MIDSPESFGANPFAQLDSSRYPDKLTSSARGLQQTPEEKKDTELFLQAIQKIPTRLPRKKSGFTIDEHCSLSTRKTIQKKTAPSSHLTKPAPVKIRDEDPFLTAMRQVTPLSGQGRRIAKKPHLKQPVITHEATLEDFMAGKLEFAISSTGEYLEGHVTGLDDLILAQLRAGRLSPEAHIDLHGLNIEQAFETLREFMRQAWLKDLRVVLVITGRGRNSPQGYGILRQRLQIWLTREPFKRIVLAFCTARPHDGGPGSIYVLLRRFKKKGPVQWDRIFIDAEE